MLMPIVSASVPSAIVIATIASRVSASIRTSASVPQ
jgi:hypothetical protein